MSQLCGRCKELKTDEEFAPSYRGKAGTWCRSCFAAYNRQRQRGIKPPPSRGHDVTLSCEWCTATFTPQILKTGKMQNRYCSPQCKSNARNAVAAADREAAKPVTRQCVHCGADMPQAMRADAKFCSENCSSRAHAITRKMHRRIGLAGRKKGAPLLERNYIAERDKFRCGICGGKVDMKLQHPDPLFGSIDHIVPLSRGGTNDLANLQLAHLRCNLSKNDRGGAEQLRLIG
jgi:5-methylcytosine-specific restriction endonuclease McrA